MIHDASTPDGEAATQAVIDAFNDAFNRQDVDAVLDLMTPDCVFEDTSPPDGRRHEGHPQVRAAFAAFFDSSPDAHFDVEDALVTGDRGVICWVYRWGGEDGGHVRGVDVFVVRDGKVAEKRSYVKG